MRVRVVIADASSLILLAKVSLLRVYASQVALLAAGQVVDEAASQELVKRHPDAREIANLIAEGLLQVRAVRSRCKLPIALGPGEAATVRLFLAEKADLVLSDDGRALRACRLLAIPFSTSPRVVVDLHRGRVISRRDARRAIEKLGVAGRYTPDIVAAALVALTEVNDGKTDDDPTP